MSSAQVPVASERAAPARGDALMSDAQLEEVVRAVSARVLEERVREVVERQTSALRQDVRALEEKVAALERRMQSFADILQEEKGALKQLEQRLAQAEREAGREGAVESSGRRESLEASLQWAVTTMMPKVEALLAQLEAPPTASSAPPPSPARAPSPATRERLDEEVGEAAAEGWTERVRELLDAGADVNAKDDNELTPLYWAAVKGHWDVVSLLLGRGADTRGKDENGWTALHWAAFNDSSGRCVSLLLDAGADVNSGDDDGSTPLHCAALNGNEAAVRALLAAGADRKARTERERRLSSTLYRTLSAASSGAERQLQQVPPTFTKKTNKISTSVNSWLLLENFTRFISLLYVHWVTDLRSQSTLLFCVNSNRRLYKE